ncbi:hypothetical protein ACIPO9_00725 [Pseudomonas sp. NPDC090203]|uniref:hypothetical protein n=1 Tax=Pseudomonas sp. NPDC090203 TaxID=3364477 RepID=UPI0038007017
MKGSTGTPTHSASNTACELSATINGKPFTPGQLSAFSCLRPELTGKRSHKIWKIHAVGKVAHRRTVLGMFIDQSLEPGTYDLVRDERLSAIYHVTPRQFAQLYHSQDFEKGSVTLLECDVQTGHLRGTFHIDMPSAGLLIADGQFDVWCTQAAAAEASAE